MLQILPDFDSFVQIARDRRVVPVYCSILSDHLTPVSAFERLAGGAEHAFLLESVIGGEKIARYSFLGVDPIATIRGRRRRSVVASGGVEETVEDEDPLAVLERLLSRYQAARIPGLPRFLGGAVGYAAYDCVRQYEPLGEPPADDRNLPDLQFCIYDKMVIFDHVHKLVHVVAHAHLDDDVDPKKAYEDACDRMSATIDTLSQAGGHQTRGLLPSATEETPFRSNMSQDEFEAAIDRCKEYIRAGDIFQVVLAQRFSADTPVEAFDIYRALRVINPSPFMFYVQSPDVTLVGASPEILCRLDGRTVSTRPLAGTRPRGRSEAEDLGLERELLSDPKERAEHVMLVDLGRNDIGRVCAPGSVKIDDLMSVERYSHVMHICSNVSGTLAEGKTAFDALRSVLPVGTVSGAPKIRAMQIIDEFEPVRRGPYGGAVGYFDFGGNMDTCIALRTLVITPTEGGLRRVDVQVGAGIVADSEPRREYEETMNKAKAMFRALELAEAWSKA